MLWLDTATANDSKAIQQPRKIMPRYLSCGSHPPPVRAARLTAVRPPIVPPPPPQNTQPINASATKQRILQVPACSLIARHSGCLFFPNPWSSGGFGASTRSGKMSISPFRCMLSRRTEMHTLVIGFLLAVCSPTQNGIGNWCPGLPRVNAAPVRIIVRCPG